MNIGGQIALYKYNPMIQEPEVEVKPAARMLRVSESFGRLEADMRDGRVSERTIEAFRGFSTEAW